MTDMISALWNGELAFCEHCGAHDDQANRLIRELAKCRDGLLAQLNEEQSLMLQRYVDQTERYTLRMMGWPFGMASAGVYSFWLRDSREYEGPPVGTGGLIDLPEKTVTPSCIQESNAL